MFSRITTGEKLFQVFAAVFVAGLCTAMVYPFLHIFSISFSTPQEAIRPGIHLFPRAFSFIAYKRIFEYDMLWIGFGNSIFRTAVGTLLSLIALTLAAYPLSKKYLPHRNFYTMFIVITMFFSGGLIPTYFLIKSVGLYDSRWVYIMPTLINTFWMLILRNFFMNIPNELEESAKIDGANDLRILFTIVVPLSKPILATLSLWSAVFHWNAWFDGLIYVQDPSKTILQILLRRLVIDNNVDTFGNIMDSSEVESIIPETVKAAVIMCVTLPILLVYPFLQKYFIKGVMVGSVKG